MLSDSHKYFTFNNHISFFFSHIIINIPSLQSYLFLEMPIKFQVMFSNLYLVDIFFLHTHFHQALRIWQSCLFIGSHKCSFTHMHAYTCTHIHILQTYLSACIHEYIHVYVLVVCMHVFRHAWVCKYIHLYKFCKVNSWDCHKANSLGCCEANSVEYGGGHFRVITLSCCHLMGVVHTVYIWYEFDIVNPKYGEKWAMMPNIVGNPACNGL